MTAITGFHTIIYSTEPEATRAFLADVLEWPHVDVVAGSFTRRHPANSACIQQGRSAATSDGPPCRSIRRR